MEVCDSSKELRRLDEAIVDTDIAQRPVVQGLLMVRSDPVLQLLGRENDLSHYPQKLLVISSSKVASHFEPESGLVNTEFHQ